MKQITEEYGLRERQLPTIPTPHDCLITDISLNDGWLIFTFEDDIAYHDAIRFQHPNAQTLTMKIHLAYGHDIELYAFEQRKYEQVFVRRKAKKLFELARKCSRLEYLYHYVMYGFIQIELCAGQIHIIRCSADRVLLE